MSAIKKEKKLRMCETQLYDKAEISREENKSSNLEKFQKI